MKARLVESFINENETSLQPKTKEELIKLINKEIEIQGNEADLNHIDVSLITDMDHIFFHNKFNGDISKWKVGNVTTMKYMFAYSKFNGDISNWDVSKVTNMSDMFTCSKFNGNISQWNVGNVTNMQHMFFSSEFNSDISKWNTKKLYDVYNIFTDSKFSGDISNWDVSKLDLFEIDNFLSRYMKNNKQEKETKTKQTKSKTTNNLRGNVISSILDTTGAKTIKSLVAWSHGYGDERECSFNNKKDVKKGRYGYDVDDLAQEYRTFELRAEFIENEEERLWFDEAFKLAQELKNQNK